MYRVLIFDRPRVECDSGAEVHFNTRKALEIALWLATHCGRANRRAVAADLWPEEPIELAQDYLRDNLYFARLALPGAIVSDRKSLQLAETVSSDWADFWLLVQQEPDARDSERLDKLMEALALAMPAKVEAGLVSSEAADVQRTMAACEAWLKDAMSSVRSACLKAALEAADLAAQLSDAADNGSRAAGSGRPLGDRLLRALGIALKIDCSLVEAHDLRIRTLSGLGKVPEAKIAYLASGEALAARGKKLPIAWEEYAALAPQGFLRRSVRPGGPRLAAVLAASVALTLLCVGTATVVLNLRWAEPRSMDELSSRLAAVRQDLRLHPGSRSDEMERARLVKWLAGQCWAKMWGADEQTVKVECARDWGDISGAFEWSLREDPQTALEIAGSGHRIFDLVTPACTWSSWIDRALAAAPKGDSLALGRALCGVVLANWRDDHPRSIQCARDAEAIFSRLGSKWDEANALRHEGLALEASGVDGTSQYLAALRAFNSIERPGSERGAAMTFESLGERSPYRGAQSEERSQELADGWYQAGRTFRMIGNERLGVYNCRMSLQEELRFQTLRRVAASERLRNELLAWAEAMRRENEPKEERALRQDCIAVDVHDGSGLHLFSDIRELVREPCLWPWNDEACAFLHGAYLGLCKRAAVAPDRGMTSLDWFNRDDPDAKRLHRAYAEGLVATPPQILDAARRLNRV